MTIDRYGKAIPIYETPCNQVSISGDKYAGLKIKGMALEYILILCIVFLPWHSETIFNASFTPSITRIGR
jgi:hypothetical protein